MFYFKCFSFSHLTYCLQQTKKCTTVLINECYKSILLFFKFELFIYQRKFSFKQRRSFYFNKKVSNNLVLTIYCWMIYFKNLLVKKKLKFLFLLLFIQHFRFTFFIILIVNSFKKLTKTKVVVVKFFLVLTNTNSFKKVFSVFFIKFT